MCFYELTKARFWTHDGSHYKIGWLIAKYINYQHQPSEFPESLISDSKCQDSGSDSERIKLPFFVVQKGKWDSKCRVSWCGTRCGLRMGLQFQSYSRLILRLKDHEYLVSFSESGPNNWDSGGNLLFIPTNLSWSNFTIRFSGSGLSSVPDVNFRNKKTVYFYKTSKYGMSTSYIGLGKWGRDKKSRLFCFLSLFNEEAKIG